jgi:hypothetical protein
MFNKEKRLMNEQKTVLMVKELPRPSKLAMGLVTLLTNG